MSNAIFKVYSGEKNYDVLQIGETSSWKDRSDNIKLESGLVAQNAINIII